MPFHAEVKCDIELDTNIHQQPDGHEQQLLLETVILSRSAMKKESTKST